MLYRYRIAIAKQAFWESVTKKGDTHESNREGVPKLTQKGTPLALVRWVSLTEWTILKQINVQSNIIL